MFGFWDECGGNVDGVGVPVELEKIPKGTGHLVSSVLSWTLDIIAFGRREG